ncbi:AAA-like domain-containing protein [Methanococcoides alaskense]|uniref:AAA+ ATPase superfamily predicted ATPase n=2 Tax=Methanococcoides alaskense TaxID=325778 RepID=A0AA90TZM8_9EURY|nr:AAA-like domain-containing protein [Methanococcoides alaskense]MDA0525716.1 AAA-like domain-containing protein [Methanococcoides alaskense]MDR6222942.1 AAA+ ATPase superfamily predicted ATPase [Methanococcoides alaskense]
MGAIVPAVKEHFPTNSRLEKALRLFLPAFDVTYTSISRYRKSATYTEYIFLKAEQSFKEGFGFEREILCIISNKSEFQAKDAEIIDLIYNENKSRVDPFVCVLLSECNEINDKIEMLVHKDPDNLCIVPFSIPDLLNNKPQIPEIRSKFQKYMFSRDLFAFESPIKRDISFFGREDILLNFIDRFKTGQNSGLFGLRKIGKTSVLYAISRRIKSKDIGTSLYFDCANPSFYKARWYDCLQILVKRLYDDIDIDKSQVNAFTSKYNEMNASDYFYDDIKLVLKDEDDRVLMMLDEIEWISFNTSSDPHWESDFIPFWQTFRSAHQNLNGKFCFMISGVNPKCIEEEAVLGYDNPLFALIDPTFLQPFDTNTTREMVRKLGRYMGIKFEEELYPKLYELYGGHPFLVRHACSKLCYYEKTRPITFNLEIFNQHADKINLSLMPYVKQILNVLAIWYPNEYQQIIELAQGNVEDIKKHLGDKPQYIEHLLGYGIVNFIDGDPKLSIFVMSKQLKVSPKNADNLLSKYNSKEANENIDDIHAEVSMRRNKIERKLRNLLKQTLKLMYGKKCMDELMKSISDHGGLNRYSYDDVWKHLYFKDLSQIIDKNWILLQNWFSRDKNEVMFWMKHINEFRVDAHNNEISNDDFLYLKVAFTRLEEALETVD